MSNDNPSRSDHCSPDELADRLTSDGAPVETVARFRDEYAGLLAGTSDPYEIVGWQMKMMQQVLIPNGWTQSAAHLITSRGR